MDILFLNGIIDIQVSFSCQFKKISQWPSLGFLSPGMCTSDNYTSICTGNTLHQ